VRASRVDIVTSSGYNVRTSQQQVIGGTQCLTAIQKSRSKGRAASSGTKDTVTRPEGSQEFFSNASSADKTLKLYEGYFHDPLSDIGKEAVMIDIRSWIGAHLPA
jgi:esterase/lipase